MFIENSQTKKQQKTPHINMLVASNITTLAHAKCCSQQLAQTSATLASCLINSTLTGRVPMGLPRERLCILPWKLTAVPNKNQWLEDVFPTEIVPVLGDMLVLGGVSHWKGSLENHRLKSAILGEEMHSLPGGWIYVDWDSIVRLFFKFHLRISMDFIFHLFPN